MKKQYLECGKIVAVHGLRGDVRVQPWSDSPEELTGYRTLYLKKGEEALPVEKSRVHKHLLLIKFAGVDTPEAAQALRGRILYLDRADAELSEGEYFVQDLLGCRVVDADTGAEYGEIYDVRPTGANDVYYLRDAAGRERLVPAIPQVVVDRDLEGAIIRIRPLEGLFDED